jgi:Type IV secretion-system coupling protein DNA-binding domain
VFSSYSVEEIIALLSKHEHLAGVSKYIESPDSGQSRGVMAEIRSVAKDMLFGSFASPKGDFSIREFVRAKQGRTLFIEYDPSYGKLLTPVYRLLFDLAIKESLGRIGNEGNIYYIIDEFARLPNLSHIEDGISSGRGLGAKFIIGTQNVSQVIEQYGPGRGASIMSNLNLIFCFRLGDLASRNLAIERYGRFFKRVSLRPSRPGEDRFEQVVESNCIEDDDICQLPVGCALVCIPENLPHPRRFQFTEYKTRPLRRGRTCPKCHAPLGLKAKFCWSCGTK